MDERFSGYLESKQAGPLSCPICGQTNTFEPKGSLAATSPHAPIEEKVLKHVELHASEAHGEDPAQWPEEEAQMVKDLIRPTA